jgi:hypothetical protein
LLKPKTSARATCRSIEQRRYVVRGRLEPHRRIAIARSAVRLLFDGDDAPLAARKE